MTPKDRADRYMRAQLEQDHDDAGVVWGVDDAGNAWQLQVTIED